MRGRCSVAKCGRLVCVEKHAGPPRRRDARDGVRIRRRPIGIWRIELDALIAHRRHRGRSVAIQSCCSSTRSENICSPTGGVDVAACVVCAPDGRCRNGRPAANVSSVLLFIAQPSRSVAIHRARTDDRRDPARSCRQSRGPGSPRGASLSCCMPRGPRFSTGRRDRVSEASRTLAVSVVLAYVPGYTSECVTQNRFRPAAASAASRVKTSRSATFTAGSFARGADESPSITYDACRLSSSMTALTRAA